MQGEEWSFRMRVGYDRIVYHVEDETESVVVERVAHRREAHRREDRSVRLPSWRRIDGDSTPGPSCHPEHHRRQQRDDGEA